MQGPGARRPSDRAAALGVAFGFSLALGIATVTIPLVALGAGYDAAAVGFLVAASSATQLATRLTLPRLLGRFPDRFLIGFAAALMSAAFVLLFVSTALPAFVVAQMAMGAGRAFFWTSSQTHAVRSGGDPVRRLVDLNLAGNSGTLTGPALAGLLASVSPLLALGAGALAAGVAAFATPLLAALPPFDRRAAGGTLRLLRRPGVDVAIWSGVVGGVWWSMLGSYVPVVLVAAGIGPAVIGWLVTLSEGSGAAALVVIRRNTPRRLGPLVQGGAFVEMAALAAIAVAPPNVFAYAPLLLLGGMAAGAVTTLGPALVALAADREDQGNALALSGMFRSVAQLAAPASVGALLAVTPLSAALLAIAAIAAAPGAVLTAVVRGRKPEDVSAA
jgi:MFS family permease